MTTSAFQQAIKLHQSGRLAEALAIYRSILKRDPRNFDCLYRQGIALAQMERFEDAGKWISRALKINPDFAQGHFDLGNLQGRLGRFAQAAQSFRAAVRLKPDFHAALHNLGNALQQLGRHEDALSCFTEVLQGDARNASALFNRGNAFKALARFEDAVADYRKAIELQPDFVQAMNNLSNALLQLNRLDDALAQSQRALALRPDHPEYLNNAGLVLDEIGRLDEALAAYDRAIAARPDYPEAWYNRAITLKKQQRYDEALVSYDRAIALRPDYADAHNNRGIALQDLRRWDEALASFDRAIKLRPGYSNAIWNRSICRLLTGDLARGWDGFEERWNNLRSGVEKEEFAPPWDGKKIPGSLLVLREQGVGDEIFYAGMLTELLAFAESLTVCIDPRLLPLYRRSFSGMTFIGPDDPGGAGPFDAQVYMASLGRYFRTRPADFAKSVHPYLRADRARARQLRKQIAGEGEFVCGLSWVSKGSGKSADKSLALDDLAPLVAMPGLRFVDLQYGDTREEQARLAARKGLSLVNVPEIDNFNDLDGLAALIEACDVVVTVSNTTAHLAAALGKPVFVMLSYAPGLLWYWHVDGAGSPWYPSVRLFRQARTGDWQGVVGTARSALAARMGNP